jgi:hypothetical protein
MVIVEITEGLTGIKAALDILKGLKGSGKSGAITSEIVELQSALIDAQRGLMAANHTHSTDIDRIRDLEEVLRNLKARGDEMSHYHLKDLGWGAFAYMLKLGV